MAKISVRCGAGTPEGHASCTGRVQGGVRCACGCHLGVEPITHPIDQRPAAGNVVRWVEAPPARGRRKLVDDLSGAIRALRANPGRWGEVKTYPSKASATTAASYLRKQAPDIEWRGCRTENGSALYGRYTGETA